ncbi:hypothetical protein ACQ86B_29130 (plasmid) [Mycolicibacterium aichiense]|uniref:hypothetical protein n=1 Tax=Mycolicibacterium aichiense TaxID=1799 RepID=UPI003D669FAD
MTDAMSHHLRRHALLLAASDTAVIQGYTAEVRRRISSGAEFHDAHEVDWFVRLRSDASI